MNGDVLLTLAITTGALALFLWNRIRVDVVGMTVMTALILTRLVTVREGVSGFANEAVLTVAAMFVLSAGLVRTGAVDLLGRWMARFAGGSELRLLVASLALVVPLSAFVNNTPVVAVMIPVLLSLARKIAARPSKLLMPMSFASQLGGTVTLIGTSTNLLVAGLALELGLPRLGLFEITPASAAMMALGVLYLLTVGRWLAPVRPAPEDPIASYELREYLSVLTVERGSPLVGSSLGEARFASEYGLQVVAVEREGERIVAPHAGTRINASDALMVRGKVTDIARMESIVHLKVSTPSVAALGDDEGTSAPDVRGLETDAKLAELMVPPQSGVVGRTLRQLGFRTHYGVPVLGIQRHGQTLLERLGEVELQSGDMLLVQGTTEELRRIHQGRDLALLGPLALPSRRPDKLKLSLPIFCTVLLLAAFDLLPILESALLGILAMFLTGCMTAEEAYEEIDWMVLVLLGTLFPLGIAMQKTGTAELLARGLLDVTAALGALGAMSAIFLLTTLLTSVISNNAAALVLTPIAIATATELGVSAMPFVVAVMISASNSFITPIGYQTNTFVYGPGGYTFRDFLRVGGPLNLLMLLAAAVVIPFFFPF